MAFRKPFELRKSKETDEATADLSHRIAGWLRLNGAVSVIQTCASCKHMARVGPAVCELAQVTPPIDTIMRGCNKFSDELDLTREQRSRDRKPAEGFEDDDIPF